MRDEFAAAESGCGPFLFPAFFLSNHAMHLPSVVIIRNHSIDRSISRSSSMPHAPACYLRGPVKLIVIHTASQAPHC